MLDEFKYTIEYRERIIDNLNITFFNVICESFTPLYTLIQQRICQQANTHSHNKVKYSFFSKLNILSVKYNRMLLSLSARV